MTATPRDAEGATTERAELARLSEAATPGPWEARAQARGEGARAFGVWLINNYAEQSGYPGAELYGVRSDADAAFIVAACNYVRDMLRAEGEAPHVEVERLREALRDFSALLPFERWPLLRPETVAALASVTAEDIVAA